MDYTKCPNCGKSFSGFFASKLLSQTEIDFINTNLGASQPGYCTGCSDDLFIRIRNKVGGEKEKIDTRLRQVIHEIPVLTSQAPVDWDYECIDMVTSQTTSGTGFITELSRSFNDLFGMGSNTTNRKIADATMFCKADLRAQCLQLGGHAVIATDIDFNEIGAGSTNMLMVCMAGTAIRLRNPDVFGPDKASKLTELSELFSKRSDLEVIEQGLN